MLQMYNVQCTLYDVHVYSTITEHKQNTQLTCGAYLHPQDAIFVVITVSVLDQAVWGVATTEQGQSRLLLGSHSPSLTLHRRDV